MKKIIAVIIISIVTIIFLLGFIDKSPKEVVSNDADVVYSINNIESNLKSIGNLNKREQDIICAVSRGLVELDIDGNIIPSLAESIDISEDGLEYDFKIRDDIYWSDGNKIKPQDIVLAFREIITEEDEISALLNVFGVSDYINSDKSFSETVGISSTENSVIMKLNYPNNDFLIELSKPQYRIRKGLLLWDDLSLNFNKIVYSGDYFISSMSEDEIVLNRSGKSSIELAKTIHLVKDTGEDLALAAFEIGTRDVVLDPPKSQLQRLKEEGKLITIPSSKAMYLAFNINNDNISTSSKKETYRLMNKAIEEYQITNSISVDLADCSYFRDDKDDLTKLQSRNVMVNTEEEVEIPKKIVLVAEETLKNKDLTDFLISWFDNNTDIILVVNLLETDDMKSISEKNYYDIALINIDASLENESLINSLSSYMTENLREMIKNSSTFQQKEELFAEIEEDLFNNYKILPLLFYNDNIAVNGNVENDLLDGNGNIVFRSLKK